MKKWLWNKLLECVTYACSLLCNSCKSQTPNFEILALDDALGQSVYPEKKYVVKDVPSRYLC